MCLNDDNENVPPVLINFGERTINFAFADEILSERTNIEIECVLVFLGDLFCLFIAARFCRESADLNVIFITRRYDARQLNPIKRFSLFLSLSLLLPLSDSSHDANSSFVYFC